MKTAGEVAGGVGARVGGGGGGGVEWRGVAAPERAGAHDLIYVETAKHAERAAGSAAVCVIAPEGMALTGKTILRSGAAKVAFAKAAALLVERAPLASGIDATPIVGPLARLAGGRP